MNGYFLIFQFCYTRRKLFFLFGFEVIGLVLCPLLRSQELNNFDQEGFDAYKKGNLDRAVADFDQAIQLDAKDVKAYYFRAETYVAKGDFDKAITDYNWAIHLAPNDAQNYFSLGLVYKDRGDNDKALADYSQAILLNPKYVIAYVNRGLTYGVKGEYDKSIDDFSKAIQLDPKLAIAYASRGHAYVDKGEYDNAIADCNQAILLDPKRTQSYFSRGRAYFCRGCTHYNKGDFDRAIEDYNEVIQIDPTNANAYNCLALLQATCPQVSLVDGNKAVWYAKKACELSEWKNPSMLGTLALAYASADDYDNAVKWETYLLTFPNLSAEEAELARRHLSIYQTHLKVNSTGQP